MQNIINKHRIFKGFSTGLMFSIVAAVLLLPGCSKDKDGYSTLESGLKYKFVKSNKGVKPAIGDVMDMVICYYTPYDSLLYDSRLVKDSFTVVLVAPTFTGGVEEGFAMMSAGDSALFKVRADSLFEKTFFTTVPSYLKPEDEIKFQVKINKIISKAYADSMKQAIDRRMRQEEFLLLEAYLTANNLDVSPTPNGAYLSITKPGTGPYPAKGDSVFVVYTGRLIDGTVFDKMQDKSNPLSFVLGQNNVIEGWEECMPLLNKGSVATMVIPSDLAYGGDEVGLLKPYSSLVFEVEIVDIRKKP